MNKMDDRAKKLLFLILGIIVFVVVIFVVAFMIGKVRNSSLTFREIEDKLTEAAEEYFEDNSEALPLSEDEKNIEVTVSTLVSEGYLKELSSYQEDDTAICDGSVKVTKTSDYYRYAPYLDCGDKYRTIYLYEKILDNIVTSEDGLYKTTQYSVDKQSVTRYIYRGEYVYNYVLIDDVLWRIVKLNEDNTITLIRAQFIENELNKVVWDNRYNIDTKGYDGINNFDDSRIRRTLDKYYDDFSTELKTKLVLTNNCVGTRLRKDSKNDGSIECSKLAEPTYVSLLPIYDYINASIDKNCKSVNDLSCSNYNYLVKYSEPWWTLTVNKNYDTTAYVVSNSASRVAFTKSNYVRMVVTLNDNIIYSGGSGKKSDPFLLK